MNVTIDRLANLKADDRALNARLRELSVELDDALDDDDEKQVLNVTEEMDAIATVWVEVRRLINELEGRQNED